MSAAKASDRVSEAAKVLQGLVGSLPGGEQRPGQLEMARRVAKTLGGDGHLAVAAGTGTGKSYAYLVPALLSNKRVVIATATKALQDQLARKDLPRVAADLGRRVRWAVLKGRSNYVCRQRLAEMSPGGEQGRLSELAASESAPTRRGGPRGRRPAEQTRAEQVRRLVEWAGRTKSGDRAELDFEPEPQVWSSLSVGADECPGALRCPSGRDCFAEKARARAASADVVVVNLHLLGAHLRSGGAVLPEHAALIVDEAHELEDVMAESLGADIAPGRVRAVAAVARGALGRDHAAPADAVIAAAAPFEAALVAAADERLPTGLGDGVGSTTRLLSSRLAGLESALREASRDSEPAIQDAGGGKDTSQRVLRSLLSVGRLHEELDGCISAEEDEVVWVAGGERPALRSAPLDVSSVLSAQVFKKMPVVLTSATLAPGLGRRLGADQEHLVELDLGSPFDYQNNAILYCAVQLPDRRRPGAEPAIHEEIELLVKAAGGRTLGLFTSRRAMLAAAEALRGRLSWPLYVQGEMPKAALLDAFSSEAAACLFETMGFWQGVDIPGPTLSLVVIDRLPFPRPDEPLVAARRSAAGAGGFREVDLPRAATMLAQGAGRLVRSASDRGVVAVLDPRLATATYSGYLVKALPKMRRTRSREEAVAFLRELAAADSPGSGQ
ncbi:MAG: ATP-dependent DNA helicase [Acidimicrobiales bacterium]